MKPHSSPALDSIAALSTAHSLRAVPPVPAVRRNRFVQAAWLLAGGLTLLLSSACGSKVASDGPASSQTHWLSACETDAQCGDLSCVCGVCTSSCTADPSCNSLGAAAVCASAGAACGAMQNPPSVCLKGCDTEEDCGAGKSCTAGVCEIVSSAQPDAGQAGSPGDACNVDADCSSGVCAGMGCGTDEGVCADTSQVCNLLATEYCSCDGVTVFGGAGSLACSGVRYAYQGPCDATDSGVSPGPTSDAGSGLLALGAVCGNSAECATGACMAETCTDEAKHCVESSNECPADAFQVCGCDGETRTASSGGLACAGGAYGFAGACRSGTQADGERCEVNEDCDSGICEGLGCGAFEGTCMAEDRGCTDDIRAYCGCNGETLIGGSSCAGGRYAYEGECQNEQGQAGAACDSGAECASGICQGQGCGEGQGVCADDSVECPAGDAAYCDCDGQTVFSWLEQCAGIRYAHAGACEPGPGAAGSACNVDSDCESSVCEGQGCGEQEGVCAEGMRACDAIAVTYCGCDGQTVYGGDQTCSGIRYEHVGECESGLAAAGDSCDVDADCQSGMCEGLGCGPGEGTCVDLGPCTADVQAYCDCEGNTVSGSSSCPGTRYEYTGACNETQEQ